MSSAPCILCKKVHEFSYDEAFQILRKTPDTLRELLDGVNIQNLSKKKAEEWSPRQILIHLIDTEYVYGFRMRCLMADNDPVLTPIDQNLWNQQFTYGDLDGTQLIRAFTPIRRVNLELLQSVDPKLYEKKGTHPEFGKVSVADFIPHMAAHDLSHLQQIRERVPVA